MLTFRQTIRQIEMSSVVQKQIIHFLERDYKKYVQPSAFERKIKTNTEITLYVNVINIIDTLKKEIYIN